MCAIVTGERIRDERQLAREHSFARGRFYNNILTSMPTASMSHNFATDANSHLSAIDDIEVLFSGDSKRSGYNSDMGYTCF